MITNRVGPQQSPPFELVQKQAQQVNAALAIFEQDLIREIQATSEIGQQLLLMEKVVRSNNESFNAIEAEVSKLPELQNNIAELDSAIQDLKGTLKQILLNKKNQK